MKFLTLIFIFFFSYHAFAYQIRYSVKGEIKTIKLRLVKVKDHRLELYGADDSIAIRKLKNLNKKEVSFLTDNKKALGSHMCQEIFKSDVVLGLNEFNNSTSFCLFKDQSLIPIDSLSSWTRRAILK